MFDMSSPAGFYWQVFIGKKKNHWYDCHSADLSDLKPEYMYVHGLVQKRRNYSGNALSYVFLALTQWYILEQHKDHGSWCLVPLHALSAISVQILIVHIVIM